MAAAALISVSVKVTGFEDENSLAGQIHEIIERFNSAAAPGAVSSGHDDAIVGYAEVPAASWAGGAIAGVLIAANTEDLDVQIGITAEVDFVIPAGQCAFIPVPTGLASDGKTIKVKYTSSGGGTYDYIVFGASA